MVQSTPPQAYAAATPVDLEERSVERSGGGPRIYYVPLSMVSDPGEWPVILDACAGLGFDTVLLSPVTDPGPTGNLLALYDIDRPHPALLSGASVSEAVAALVAQCKSRGLKLLADLVVDRVAADGPLARKLNVQDQNSGAWDPRVPPVERNTVTLHLQTGEMIAPLNAFVTGLLKAGLAGFRCLRPAATTPEVWSELFSAVRQSGHACRMLAWTPGVPADQVGQLARAGFDGAFSSLAWWDCKAGWPAEEHDQLRALGPVIASPEAPFEARIAQALDTDEVIERRVKRALWVAATLGDGIMVPMGLEFGAREAVSPTGHVRETFAALRNQPRFDFASSIRDVNAFLTRDAERFAGSELRLLTGGAAPVTTLMRVGTDEAARLVLINPALDRAASQASASLSAEVGQYLPLRDTLGSGPNLGPESVLALRPGEVRVLEGSAGRPIHLPVDHQPLNPDTAVEAPRLAIEAITPAVDGGRYPVKRIVGEVVRVEADAFGEGHDPIAVALLWRAADEETWQERRMTFLGNDRWTADLPLSRLGRYYFTVETWRDEFAIYRSELTKKHEAGLAVGLELEEGRLLLEHILAETTAEAGARLKPILDRLAKAENAERLDILLSVETAEVMSAADPRPFRLRHPPIPIDAERKAAGFASWYELFPRSQSNDAHRHGTFDDVIARLPAVRAMGFDVLYFPPIHPIGRTNRKGRNNSLTAGPDDPGSPYAIGAEAGGHDAIHPELGTFEDFRRLVAAAAEHGMELALDLAIQASPDHPWLKQHPDWFNWRPDGTIRYAENPPKKYEDIVNVDFYAEGAKPSLWTSLRDTIMLWVEQGVKLFRVDNPHTKPFPFWEWVIADVRRDHPDVVFLSEAFTRPKVMYRLAKIGFSQSYTYFTWRNTKAELTEYLTELSTEAPKDFFRPHFFVNTHDINPDFLQNAPRSAYLIRAALATTMSGLWGMYNGFEICEGRPDQKKKEYADSEKYQLYVWDWDRPGNIIREITQLNRIRRENPALHSHLGITFRQAWNDNVLFFEKATAARDNVVLIAVSLDPYHVQEADVEIPLWEWGLPDHGTLGVEDLMRGHRFTWTGKRQRIRLDPGEHPFSIWRLSAGRGF